MKKISLLCLILISVLLPIAAESVVQYQLVVTCDEKIDKYVLNEKPEVTFDSQLMIVSVNGQEFTNYSRFDVTDIRFEEVESEPSTPNVPTSLDQTEKNTLRSMTFTYIDGKNIYLENVEKDTRISVYDLTGRLLRPNVEYNGGNVKINLENIPCGTLVVVVGTKSYKIIKPCK